MFKTFWGIPRFLQMFQMQFRLTLSKAALKSRKNKLVILLNSSRCSRICRITKIWSLHPLFDLKAAWLGRPQYNGSNLFFKTALSILKAIVRGKIPLLFVQLVLSPFLNRGIITAVYH